METWVIKYGGAAMVDSAYRQAFLNGLKAYEHQGIQPILVHGGGPKISEWERKLGREPRFLQGLRVTDAEGMELAEMILSGLVGHELVAALQDVGLQAVALSGRDGGLVQAEPIDEATLGHVGEVTKVDVSLLRVLLQAGYLPVISPIGQGPKGPLNLNGDVMAAHLAITMRADALIFLTDVPGVKVDGAFQSRLAIEELPELMAKAQLTGGMIPKVTSAARAVMQGVGRVMIVDAKQFDLAHDWQQMGTQLTKKVAVS